MRARVEAIWRNGGWVEGLALIAGAIVVVVAVWALGNSGPSHGRRPSRVVRPRNLSPLGVGHSPTGAVEAATVYLGLLAETAAADDGGAGGRLSALTTGSLRTELQQQLPVLAHALRARLASTAAPAAFDGWPLGYRVTSYSAAGATVSVWHLDVAASSTLALMSVDYATTTYEVRWVDGTWRIAHTSNAAGPTPPRSDAPAANVDGFAAAVRQFSGYRYAP